MKNLTFPPPPPKKNTCSDQHNIADGVKAVPKAKGNRDKRVWSDRRRNQVAESFVQEAAVPRRFLLWEDFLRGSQVCGFRCGLPPISGHMGS